MYMLFLFVVVDWNNDAFVPLLRYVYLSKLHFWVALIGIKAYYFYRDKGLWWKPNGINPFVLVSKEGDCV